MELNVERKLLHFILAADRRSANELIEGWAKEYGYKRALTELLEPALDQFGELWAVKEDISLAQGYIAAKIAEDAMLKLEATLPQGETERYSLGPVVIGNIEDDYHALGRKLVTTFLRSAGWKVHDIGNDAVAEDFLDMAMKTKARVIAVSAMMYTTAMNIKKVREEIDRRGLGGKIQLAVGGAVFRLRPELVVEVGADGTARNAVEVPHLIETLWERAEKAAEQDGEKGGNHG